MENQKPKQKTKVTAQSALEYVCWLADPNKMYEVALGTYDLDLVAMVGLQTQKDPREYMPYLQSLREIPDPLDRQVQICLDQKHYHKAV